MQEMRRMADELRDQVNRMKDALTWGEWEPYTVGIIPMRVNGHWYFKGDTIYRRQRFGPGGAWYQYGDDFDKLKESHD